MINIQLNSNANNVNNFIFISTVRRIEITRKLLVKPNFAEAKPYICNQD